MTIEDIIRRIVREEIDKRVIDNDEPLTADDYEALAVGDKVFSADLRRPIVPRWDPPSVTPARTGCTCPPGRTSSACPDPTCPWKPR